MTGSDRQQLSSMAGMARDAMGAPAEEVLADRRYFSGEEILACEAAGVTPYVPKPFTSGARANGRFSKQDFVDIPDKAVQRCPAGQLPPRHMTTTEKGLTTHKYWDLASGRACGIRRQGTFSENRRITRWAHDAVIDAMQRRMDLAPYSMRARRRIVEHPFGTIKAWMGFTPVPHEAAEERWNGDQPPRPRLHMKRMISILGTKPLTTAMQA